jgi:hypothetical protein
MRGLVTDLVCLGAFLALCATRRADAPPIAHDRPSPPAASAAAGDAVVDESAKLVAAPAEKDMAAIEAKLGDEIAWHTERGAWRYGVALPICKAMYILGPRRARAHLENVGFDAVDAGELAIAFSKRGYCEQRVEHRHLFEFSFVRRDGVWVLSDRTRESLALRFKSSPRISLRPIVLAQIDWEGCEAVGEHTFESGATTNALRCLFRVGGRRLALLTSEAWLRDDKTLMDRLELALSMVPRAHLDPLEVVVFDPGEEPAKRFLGMTSHDGARVTFFLGAGGANVPVDDFLRVTAHEMGHVVSSRMTKPQWKQWADAIAQDPVATSGYALTNDHEDFAETYVVYLGGGRSDAATRARYPRRFAILDAMFRRALSRRRRRPHPAERPGRKRPRIVRDALARDERASLGRDGEHRPEAAQAAGVVKHAIRTRARDVARVLRLSRDRGDAHDDALGRRCELPPRKIVTNVEESSRATGATRSSATPPLGLGLIDRFTEADDRFTRGEEADHEAARRIELGVLERPSVWLV